MKKTIHMCVDIEGLLRQSDKLLGNLYEEKGSKVRAWLKLQLAHGKRVLPMGEICEGFSFETGCPGHEIPEEASPLLPPVNQRQTKPGE